MDALKRILLWDYRRASWQYDVIVGVLVIFIFMAPHYISFGDQPKAASVAMVHGGYWIESQQLDGVPQVLMVQRAARIVNAKYKIHAVISSVEPIYDGTELKGYLAFPQR